MTSYIGGENIISPLADSAKQNFNKIFRKVKSPVKIMTTGYFLQVYYLQEFLFQNLLK